MPTARREDPGAGPSAAPGGFWHRRVPRDPICVYRIGFGLLLAWDALRWLPHTSELFSNRGFHLGLLSGYAPSESVARFLCAMLVVSAGLVALGAATRPALAVTVTIWTYFYSIDQISEKAINSIAIVVMVILLFSRCGDRFSLDAWRLARRPGAARPREVCVFPQRLLQLEFAQVYVLSSFAKMSNPEWWNGNVFALTLNSRFGSDLGVWVSGWIPFGLARAAAVGAIAYELVAGVLLFVPRARRFVIITGVLFHLGIQSMLTIGSLGLHFIWALVCLYPDPAALARIVERLGEWRLPGLRSARPASRNAEPAAAMTCGRPEMKPAPSSDRAIAIPPPRRRRPRRTGACCGRRRDAPRVP